jgi:hypothetical protein
MQCLEASSRALELQALSFTAISGLVTDTIHVLEVCMSHPTLLKSMQEMRAPSIRATLRRLLTLDVDSILIPQLLTSALVACNRIMAHSGCLSAQSRNNLNVCDSMILYFQVATATWMCMNFSEIA